MSQINNLHDLPLDVIVSIFKPLKVSDLLCRIFLVCKSWYQMMNTQKLLYTELLLKPRLRSEAVQHIQYYIDKKLVSLSLLLRYGPLIKILNQGCFKKCEEEYYRSNPTQASSANRTSFCNNGWHTFCISAPSTIKAFDSRTLDTFELTTEKGDDIIQSIGCHKHFVFALCTNGSVIQWNSVEKKQVQTAQTQYVKDSSPYSPPGFVYLKESVLIIYPKRENVWDFAELPYDKKDKIKITEIDITTICKNEDMQHVHVD